MFSEVLELKGVQLPSTEALKSNHDLEDWQIYTDNLSNLQKKNKTTNYILTAV